MNYSFKNLKIENMVDSKELPFTVKKILAWLYRMLIERLVNLVKNAQFTSLLAVSKLFRVMDGLQLGKRLAESMPSTKIIVFSGCDDFEYTHQAIKINVIECVLKPINFTILKS